MSNPGLPPLGPEFDFDAALADLGTDEFVADIASWLAAEPVGGAASSEWCPSRRTSHACYPLSCGAFQLDLEQGDWNKVLQPT